MKVCWLAPYPVGLLLPELKVTSLPGQTKGMWLVNLSNALSGYSNIELHIVTQSSKIKYDQTIFKNNIYFHVIKYSFIKDKGFLECFPINVVFWYRGLVKKMIKKIAEINPDLIHAHGTEYAYSLAGLKTGIRNITSIQGIVNEIIKQNLSLTLFFQKFIESYCIRNQQVFGCRTAWDCSYIKKINPGSTIYYLPEAISKDFFNSSWHDSNNCYKLAYTGGFLKRKGIEIIVEAINYLKEEFPEISVLVVGCGKKKYRNKILKIISKYKISNRFEFVGFIDSKQLASRLIDCGIYVHPTFIDNSPNSLCEAMALGMPVIASNTGGIPSLVQDLSNGLLFESGNISEFINKITGLLKNPQLSKKIGYQAKCDAFKRHFPDAVASITIDVYNKILR